MKQIVLSFALLFIITGAASAAPPPKHDRKNFNTDQVRTRLLDECIFALHEDPANKDTKSQKCHCYASRLIRSLSDEEIQSYRDSGKLRGTANEKAIAAEKQCRIN